MSSRPTPTKQMKRWLALVGGAARWAHLPSEGTKVLGDAAPSRPPQAPACPPSHTCSRDTGSWL